MASKQDPTERTVETLDHACFTATLTGRIRRNGVAHVGPTLVDVVVEQSTDHYADGTSKTYAPSYYVYVDGEHVYGGRAEHLDGDLSNAVTRNGSFCTVTPRVLDMPGADNEPSGPSYIHTYAESLGHGRAIMRCDVVVHGELVESHTVGSPAPIETVRKHERKVTLNVESPSASAAVVDGARCICYELGATGPTQRHTLCRAHDDEVAR